MKSVNPFVIASTLFLAACSTTPQNSVATEEICDVKAPVLGSRVVEKVRCEAPKKELRKST